MFKIFALLLGFAMPLMAADTLWVAGQTVFPKGFVIYPTKPPNKVNIAFRMLTRNSKGAVDTSALQIRLWGMDTTKCQLRFTTSDTLPTLYGKQPITLDPAGKFIVKPVQMEP